METREAKRLMSPTMRTRDRQVRDLLADEEQLARYGLPLWRTEADLAAALDIPITRLRYFSMHRQWERVCHYVQFTIPKRSGGERIILAPKRELKSLQRKLVALLIRRLPVSAHAHAFRRGRSVRSNAQPHVGQRVLLRLDLADFFPSVHVGRVRGLLIALGYGYIVAQTLAVLMTECRRQAVEIGGHRYHVPVSSRHCVQGAPTSPGICNALLLRLDRRLHGLARRCGFAYTRYADDLTFSGNDPAAAHHLRVAATRVLAEEGFTLNTAKTRLRRSGARQVVTGVVVNRELGLSRQTRRRLRAAIHQLRRETDPERRARQLARLRGKLAYLAMLNPAQAAPLAAQLAAVARQQL
jgi:hypothetical protein